MIKSRVISSLVQRSRLPRIPGLLFIFVEYGKEKFRQFPSPFVVTGTITGSASLVLLNFSKTPERPTCHIHNPPASLEVSAIHGPIMYLLQENNAGQRKSYNSQTIRHMHRFLRDINGSALHARYVRIKTISQ